MDLREAIRTLIRELAGEEIRDFVREVILKELVGDSPRVVAAKKAVATKRAKAADQRFASMTAGVDMGRHDFVTARGKRTETKRAKSFGIWIGQKYRGKPTDAKTKHRTIEILRVDDRYIYPKILGSKGQSVRAKRITFENLLRHYDRIQKTG